MMGENSIIIQTEGLKKIYGTGEAQVMALAGIDLRINRGEFVAIMGPSGSGKSTLLNILSCLDRPSEGKYYLDGVDVGHYNRHDLAIIRGQKIGMVFQAYNLLPRLTAIENVMLPLFYQRNRRLSPEEARARAAEALKSVGLGDRLNHYPNQLSGGQQQRVAIARALVNNSVIILADEPTGNLDSRASQEIMGLLSALHGAGRTIVIVTHDREVASQTERIILIRDGLIVSDNNNGRILTSPQSSVLSIASGG